MRPITGLLLGSVLIPSGLLLAMTWVPSSISDRSAYSQASSCSSPDVRARSCWTETPATVTATRVFHHRRGNDDWEVDLKDDFGAQVVDVAHQSTFNQLAAGDQVVARFWNGNIVLLHVSGAADLPTDEEPGRQVIIAILCAVFVLFCGAIFFLGELGLHRHHGTWTYSASRSEWSASLFDAVGSRLRLWLESIIVIGFFTLGIAGIAWSAFDVPILPATLVCLGLGALGWAWLLHQRARMVMEGRAPGEKRR